MPEFMSAQPGKAPDRISIQEQRPGTMEEGLALDG